jgi:hypothetical protein
MGNSTWIETKRDADLDESGKAVVKKVQLEPAGFTGKNRVDLILRIIGLAAIITPIMLVYLQQRASLNTQKAILQLEVYSQTASQLSTICRRPITSNEFAKSKEELTYNIPPRVAFLFSEAISNEIEEINLIIPVYEAIGHNMFLFETIFNNGNTSGSTISSYRFETEVHFEDSVERQSEIRLVDSCRVELIYWHKTLQEFNTNNLLTDTAIKQLISQMLNLDEKMLQFTTFFSGDLNSAYDILKNNQSPIAPGNKEVFESLKKGHQEYLQMQPAVSKNYKSIYAKAKKILELKIKKMQAEMRKTNSAFQD